MHLTYRAATPDDLAACAALLPGEIPGDAEWRASLPGLWERWRHDGSLLMTVLEDGDRPAGQRLLAFGDSVFVGDGFLRDAQTRLPPPISRQVIAQAAQGHSPVLTSAAIRRHNAGAGLNVLVMHLGWDGTALDADGLRRVKSKLIEAFVFAHAGYRLKSITQEVLSDEELQRGLAIGTRLRTDYARFYESGALPLPMPDRRPYLIGVTCDEVQDGSTLAPLFIYEPPRFSFTGAQQEMLRLALQEQSDHEIAQLCGISASMVHKRWLSIFERVAAHSPAWFPAPSPDASPGTRGVEKRRPLLAYLRAHPEELRPTAPGLKTGSSVTKPACAG